MHLVTPLIYKTRNRGQLSKYSQKKTNVNIKHFKPFECPTYVLQNYNKTHHPQIERKSQSWHISGKFLPQHGRDISLVLFLYTRLVRPQFNVKMIQCLM